MNTPCRLIGLALVVMAALTSGCASTDRVILDSTKRTPTTNVDVYKVGEKPKQAFKEVARLSFMGPREDELKALKHFIGEGKKLGANGILLDQTEDGGMRGGFNGGFKSTFVFKATAIAYQ